MPRNAIGMLISTPDPQKLSTVVIWVSKGLDMEAGTAEMDIRSSQSLMKTTHTAWLYCLFTRKLGRRKRACPQLH